MKKQLANIIYNRVVLARTPESLHKFYSSNKFPQSPNHNLYMGQKNGLNFNSTNNSVYKSMDDVNNLKLLFSVCQSSGLAKKALIDGMISGDLFLTNFLRAC